MIAPVADVVAQVREEAGVLTAPPRVAWQPPHGSIHDPGIARQFGFRGGIVAGSRHLNVFAPLMLRLWGMAAFERGGVSLYFEDTVVAGELIQPFVQAPEARAARGSAWLMRPEPAGARVGVGTVTLGDHGASELRTRDLRFSDVTKLRILRELGAGVTVVDAVVTANREQQLGQLESGEINEPLPWYRDGSPWGGPIAALSTAFGLPFRPAHEAIERMTEGSTPMGGAVEVGFVGGPIFLDRPYRVHAASAGVGQSPKTEYVCLDFTVADHEDRPVAIARQVYRFLKQGSARYLELAG